MPSAARARARADRGLLVRVPAKVNLFLTIGVRRPDGYHDIETVFHTIGLWDDLTLRPASRLAFRRSGLPSPSGPANLCLKAARALRAIATEGGAPYGSPEGVSGARKRGGPPPGAAITLHKRIPAGAGLGGGSADAAGVLLGLNRLWRLRLSAARLARIAVQLGADVPFLLRGGAAAGRGRGERLAALPSRLRAWAIVAKPRYGVSTREAYAAWDRLPVARRPCPAATLASVVRAVRTGALDRLRVHNDFEAVVAARHPAWLDLRAALLRAGARPVFMTGSGSAVVGMFLSRSEAARAARRLRAAGRIVMAARLAPLKPRMGSGLDL